MNQPARKPLEQQRQKPTEEDLPVGEILRRTRLHYNRTVEEVEVALRIQGKQIEAIEKGDRAALPPRVYAIGFVKTYAEYLGLDGDKIVAVFKKQNGFPEAQTQAHNLQTASAKPTAHAWIIALLILIGGTGLAGLYAYKTYMPQTGAVSNNEAVSSLENKEASKITREDIVAVPEVPKELKPETLEEKQRAAMERALETEEAKPAQPKQEGIVLKLLSNSWVEIRDKNNRKLISRVLNEGDQYFVPDRLGLKISVGNAAGVEILIDGEPLENLGRKGQVIRSIPLNKESLLQRFTFAKKPAGDDESNLATTTQNQ